MNDMSKLKPEEVFEHVELIIAVAEHLSPGQKVWHFRSDKVLKLFEEDRGITGRILRKVYNRRQRLVNEEKNVSARSDI